MDYKEACAYLRISPSLLKWYGTYAPMSDGTKLRESRPGEFLKTDLDAFDAHVRGPWPDRRVPSGITRELILEAAGQCGVCCQPCEKLEEAHIERKGVEVTHYCQHPQNLVLLCGNCHNRYDDQNLKAINQAVVSAAKQRLVGRKMEAIDRDVKLAKAIRDTVEAQKAELREQSKFFTQLPLTNAALWQGGAVDLLSAIVKAWNGASAPSLPALDAGAIVDSLQLVTGSLPSPGETTHAVLDGYSQEAAGTAEDAPAEWDLIDNRVDYECDRCGELKDTVDYECGNCGNTDSNTDPPDHVLENDEGVLVPSYTDARGDSNELNCSKCGSGKLELSYPESYCSRCDQNRAKDD